MKLWPFLRRRPRQSTSTVALRPAPRPAPVFAAKHEPDEPVVHRLCRGYAFDDAVRGRALVVLAAFPTASAEEIGYIVARELTTDIQNLKSESIAARVARAAAAADLDAAKAERAASAELDRERARLHAEIERAWKSAIEFAGIGDAARAEIAQLRAENERLRSAPDHRGAKNVDELRQLRADLEFMRKTAQAQSRKAAELERQRDELKRNLAQRDKASSQTGPA